MLSTGPTDAPHNPHDSVAPRTSYDERVSENRGRTRLRRAVLVALLVLAILVLTVAAVVALPILMHQSVGGSGQVPPTDFVAEASAEGADGRTRTLSVETASGTPANLSSLREGDEFIVRGSGYDPGIGIYISICAVPEQAGAKPTPCLGGVPEGAMQGEAAGSDEAASSAWVTDDWAWRAFATRGYDQDPPGSFEVRLLVPPPTQEGLDCTRQKCAVTTRADHTASGDRVQDMQLPVAFAE